MYKCEWHDTPAPLFSLLDRLPDNHPIKKVDRASFDILRQVPGQTLYVSATTTSIKDSTVQALRGLRESGVLDRGTPAAVMTFVAGSNISSAEAKTVYILSRAAHKGKSRDFFVQGKTPPLPGPRQYYRVSIISVGVE